MADATARAVYALPQKKQKPVTQDKTPPKKSLKLKGTPSKDKTEKQVDEKGSQASDKSGLHMMSHSLAFQMFLEQQRNHIFNKKNSDISSIGNKLVQRASESNFDQNRSVHTKVLRPRTFDP